jgi:uncharacterized protein
MALPAGEVSMPFMIAHDVARTRFETVVDGEHASLLYRPEADAVHMTEVQVPAAIEGRGIAGALTKAALDWARAEGLKVVPACPYVASWVGRHAGYSDLLAAD